jgi:hypothetical protein
MELDRHEASLTGPTEKGNPDWMRGMRAFAPLAPDLFDIPELAFPSHRNSDNRLKQNRTPVKAREMMGTKRSPSELESDARPHESRHLANRHHEDHQGHGDQIGDQPFTGLRQPSVKSRRSTATTKNSADSTWAAVV